MADKKVSDLVALNTLSGDDLLLVVNDPAGTPSSRKISVGNVFGNVAVESTHKAKTTFHANVAFITNKVTATANVAVTGDLSVNGYSVLTELDSKQSAATSASDLANTNLAIADRMQVANVVSNYLSKTTSTEQFVAANCHIASSNTTTGVAIRENSVEIKSSGGSPASLILYSTAITSNAFFAKSTLLTVKDNTLLSNNVFLSLPTSNGELALVDGPNQELVANTLTVTANTGLVVAVSSAPSSNNPATEGWAAGTMAFSNNYLYIAVDANTIKRVPLEIF